MAPGAQDGADTCSRFCAFFGTAHRSRVAYALAYLGVQATRWSLAQADRRTGRRNLWLRALDAAGMGYDS